VAGNFSHATCSVLTSPKSGSDTKVKSEGRVLMSSTEEQTIHRVLLVDDDEVVLGVMSESVKSNGFEVVAVGGVTEALKCIATESDCFTGHPYVDRRFF